MRLALLVALLTSVCRAETVPAMRAQPALPVTECQVPTNAWIPQFHYLTVADAPGCDQSQVADFNKGLASSARAFYLEQKRSSDDMRAHQIAKAGVACEPELTDFLRTREADYLKFTTRLQLNVEQFVRMCSIGHLLPSTPPAPSGSSSVLPVSQAPGQR